MRHNAQNERLRVVNACSSAGALILDSCRKSRIFQAWVWALKINIYLGIFPELLYLLSFFSIQLCTLPLRVQLLPWRCPLIWVTLFPPKIPSIVASLCGLRDELLTSFNEEELGHWAMDLPQRTWDGENKMGQPIFNLNPMIISQEWPQKPIKLYWSKTLNWGEYLSGLTC